MERTLESTRVGLISPDFSIDFDQALLDDSSDFTASKSVFQSVTEKDGEGQRFAKFVRTGGGTGSLKFTDDQTRLQLSKLSGKRT